MELEEVFFWRYRCEIRNRMVRTRYKTTWAKISIEHPDATPVDGSSEVRHINADPFSCSTSAFLRGVDDLGNGISHTQCQPTMIDGRSDGLKENS